MATKKEDAALKAFKVVYAALRALDATDRQKVLSSLFALLEIPPVTPSGAPLSAPARESPGTAHSTIQPSSRPLSLVEMIQEKKPGTNAQRIAVFAYYRERHEGQSRFGREDLRAYFAKAKLAPAGNYDRDFVEAVKKGWVHEDGTESYLTSKGIEVVESGFQGERKVNYSRPRSAPKRKRKTSNRRRAKRS